MTDLVERQAVLAVLQQHMAMAWHRRDTYQRGVSPPEELAWALAAESCLLGLQERITALPGQPQTLERLRAWLHTHGYLKRSQAPPDEDIVEMVVFLLGHPVYVTESSPAPPAPPCREVLAPQPLVAGAYY
jgi:hypothetical protein